MALYLGTEQGRFSSFFQDKIIRFSFSTGFFLNLAAWLVIGRWVSSAPELIPLHYNIYFGIDWFGNWSQLFIAPAFGLGVLLVNTMAGFFLHERDKILSYFLQCVSAGVELILLVGSLIIIFINL